MRKIFTSILLALALLVSGCTFVIDDFRSAGALASKYGDKIAADCYSKIATDLELNDAIRDEPGKGLIALIEKLRLLRLQLEQNRTALETACGPIALDVMIQGLKGLPGVR